jgi:hypothetical protein
LIYDPSRFGEFRGPRRTLARGGRYRHPLGWYTLSIPPGWSVADESEPIRLLTAEEDAAAVVSVTKLATGRPPVASIAMIAREVPGLRVIARAGGTEGEVRGMRFAQIEEVVGEPPPWWAPWRKGRADSHIVTASFTRGPLLAMITFEVPPDKVERHRLALGALIGSFELCDRPVPSQEEFLGRFFAIARERIPQKKVVATGPLSVSVDGSPLALEQHYRALSCDPEIGDGVFDRIFAFFTTEASPPSAVVAFDEVKDDIALTIKPREWLDAADRGVPERQRVLRIPFPNETALVFVVDHPHVMRFVSVEESERWEVPPKEMYAVARKNLLRMRAQITHRAILDPFGRLAALAIAEGDGYDASRICLPGLYEQLRERLGDSFAIAIPNRDLLIAFVTDDLKVVDAIERRAAEDVGRRPYPITGKFFRLTEEGTITEM